MNVRVNFKKLDYDNNKFRTLAEKMSKFVYGHQEYFYHLAYVIRNSKNWTLENYQVSLSEYVNPLQPIKEPNRDEATDKEYSELLRGSYSLCRSNEDIHILRGILTEWVFFLACKNKSNRNWTLEFGCSVSIDNFEIEYVNVETGESKKTVDLGAWNFLKQSEIFAEVKVSPKVFKTKDGCYLQNLRNRLQHIDSVKYKIYIFSLKLKSFMETQMEFVGYATGLDTIVLDPDGLFTEDFFGF